MENKFDAEKLKTIFQENELQVNGEQIEKFEKFYYLLLQENEKYNLTAITEFEEVCLKHFVDSAILIKHENLKGRLIDVGSGAGFPGIVLKIMEPKLEIVLLESLEKRVNFLRYIIEEICLEDIEVIHMRAEDGGKCLEYREQFDYAVSRAVARLNVLEEYLIPFVKVGGKSVAYKGEMTEEEEEEGRFVGTVLGGNEVEIKRERLVICEDVDIGDGSVEKFDKTGDGPLKNEKVQSDDGDDGDRPREKIFKRCFFIVKKVKSTEKKYPRRPGKVQKNPIKREK